MQSTGYNKFKVSVAIYIDALYGNRHFYVDGW